VRGKACSRSLETRKEGRTDEDGSLGYCPSSSDQLAGLGLRSVVRAADHPTRIGLRLADLQWVVTGYALMFGILLLLSGRAGDQLGRRLLMLGLLFFGLALSPLMLTLSRLVQRPEGVGLTFGALAADDVQP
jgi:MFS family permease